MSDSRIKFIGRPVDSQIREKLECQLLNPADKQRTLPSALLWGDDVALELFEHYSTIPEYYPTHDEITLFREWGSEIADQVQENSVLIDLGCGSVEKIKPLLDVLESTRKPSTYYALDLSSESLERQLQRLASAQYEYVRCAGLCGTFEDVRKWAAQVEQPIFFISLGSIFGNDEFDIAVRDFKLWSETMRKQDRMLIGLDACQDTERIWKSYNTRHPEKPTMVEHALELSNDLLGKKWYKADEWSISGITEQHEHVSTHQWIAQATVDVNCEALQLHISSGEQIKTTKWFKWGPEGMSKQFASSQLNQIRRWQSPTGPFRMFGSILPMKTLDMTDIPRPDQYLVRSTARYAICCRAFCLECMVDTALPNIAAYIDNRKFLRDMQSLSCHSAQ